MSASKSQFGFNNYHLTDDVIELYIFWQINFDISLIWELSSNFIWICWYRLFTKPASSVAPMQIARDRNVHKLRCLERWAVSSSSPCWRNIYKCKHVLDKNMNPIKDQIYLYYLTYLTILPGRRSKFFLTMSVNSVVVFVEVP